MSLLSGLVGPGAKVNIKLHGYEERLKKEVSSGKGTTHLLPIYEAHEVCGSRRGPCWERKPGRSTVPVLRSGLLHESTHL